MMNKKYKTQLLASLAIMICVVFAVTLLVNVKGIHAGERGPRVGVVDGTHPELFRGVAFFDSSEVRAADEPAKVDTAGVDTLRVTVKGLKAGKGNIRVAVFDDAHREEFPEGKYLYGAVVPADKEQVTVAIANVLPGEYAIAVFQDINENEKLDRNIVTKPKEPYGFSGAWKSGGASYEEALIDTEKVGFSITIKLK
jgi:uncharacterized protein (DUF2141 family)